MQTGELVASALWSVPMRDEKGTLGVRARQRELRRELCIHPYVGFLLSLFHVPHVHQDVALVVYLAKVLLLSPAEQQLKITGGCDANNAKNPSIRGVSYLNWCSVDLRRLLSTYRQPVNAGVNAFFAAGWLGHLDYLASMLMEHGRRSTTSIALWTAALHGAIVGHHYEMVQWLLENTSAEVDAQQGHRRYFSAQDSAHAAIMRRHGFAVDDDYLSDDKSTALHVAVRARASRELPLLLRYSRNPNIGNTDGNSALHLAAQLAFPEMVRSLLGTHLVNPTCRNNGSETPLHCATGAHNQQYRSSIAGFTLEAQIATIASLLSHSVVNLNAKDVDGTTALDGLKFHKQASELLQGVLKTEGLQPAIKARLENCLAPCS